MTLPEPRRITLFAGHYGSGKTNVALNYARRLRRLGSGPVTIADLDIVNPYFRTKDFADELLREGIGLVVSEFANSNVDFPAMPKEIYSLAAPGEGETGRVVMDIGGDDRGALALGRYVDDIRAGGDYEMVGVVNASRPLTRTPEDAAEVLGEIEEACGLRFTGIVNNTNLGQQTTARTVLDSLEYAESVAALAGVDVLFTCCRSDIAPDLEGRVERLMPLEILKQYYQMEE